MIDNSQEEITTFLYSEYVQKVVSLLSELLESYSGDESGNDAYCKRLQHILSLLSKNSLFFTSNTNSEFESALIDVFNVCYVNFSDADLQELRPSYYMNSFGISPDKFLFKNFHNIEIVQRSSQLENDWWSEHFNIYDYLERVESDNNSVLVEMLEAPTLLSTLLESDLFYIAYGLVCNIEPYIHAITLSSSDFKYKLLSFRQHFIDSDTEDKLDNLKKLGQTLYGEFVYSLLCSLMIHTAEAIIPGI